MYISIVMCVCVCVCVCVRVRARVCRAWMFVWCIEFKSLDRPLDGCWHISSVLSVAEALETIFIFFFSPPALVHAYSPNNTWCKITYYDFKIFYHYEYWLSAILFCFVGDFQYPLGHCLSHGYASWNVWLFLLLHFALLSPFAPLTDLCFSIQVCGSVSHLSYFERLEVKEKEKTNLSFSSCFLSSYLVFKYQ